MDVSIFLQLTAIAGVSVALATELLKSQYIPVPAQKYPRVTALVLSLATATYGVYQYNAMYFSHLNASSVMGLTAVVLLVASVTYNQLLKGLNK